MNAEPSREWLDVAAFAAAASHLQGSSPLSQFPRLAQDCLTENPAAVRVRWQASGLRLTLPGAGTLPALHLQAQAELPLACQLCLDGMRAPVAVDRRFVFVASEEVAARLDEQAEDVDVLTLAPRLDLLSLLEDELLMALPLAPRHQPACPQQAPMSAQSEDFEATTRINPFASLSALKTGGGKGDSSPSKA